MKYELQRRQDISDIARKGAETRWKNAAALPEHTQGNAEPMPQQNRGNAVAMLGEERRGEERREDTSNVIAKSLRKNEVNEIIKSFADVNPTYERLFANTTQRAAVERLLKKFGLEQLREMVRTLPAIIGKPYAPRVTTPLELERDLGKLVAFSNQERQKSTPKTTTAKTY